MRVILLTKVNGKLAHCPVIMVSSGVRKHEIDNGTTAANVFWKYTHSEIMILLSLRTLDIDNISFFDLVSRNKGFFADKTTNHQRRVRTFAHFDNYLFYLFDLSRYPCNNCTFEAQEMNVIEEKNKFVFAL